MRRARRFGAWIFGQTPLRATDFMMPAICEALFLASRAEGNQGNAMKFVVGSELYDHLEKVVDRFDDVANEINSIVIEQV